MGQRHGRQQRHRPSQHRLTEQQLESTRDDRMGQLPGDRSAESPGSPSPMLPADSSSRQAPMLPADSSSSLQAPMLPADSSSRQAPGKADDVTPGKVAAVVLAGSDMMDERPIRLASGIVMPRLAVRAMTLDKVALVTFGDDKSGQVALSFDMDSGTPTRGELNYFFYHYRLTSEYRAALARATRVSPPHVFMLLIDELVCEMLGHRPNPSFELVLEDAADLGETDAALRGRTLLRPARNTGFLQWARGLGYYATFGFWPVGMEPEEYMASAATVRGLEPLVAGERGFTAANQTIDRHARRLGDPGKWVKWVKRYPPVLPAIAPGGPVRRFATLVGFYDDIVVGGGYGKGVGLEPVDLERPGRQPRTRRRAAPRTLRRLDPDRVFDALAAGRDFDIGGRFSLLGVNADGVRAGFTGEIIDVDLGSHELALTPGQVLIDGPFSPELPRLCEAMSRALGYPPPRLVWTPTSDGQEVLVAGSRMRADSAFLDSTTDGLVGLGFVPEGVGDVAGLLERARRCDAATGGRVVLSSDPAFGECADVARALSARWVREPVAGGGDKRARQSQPRQQRPRRRTRSRASRHDGV